MNFVLVNDFAGGCKSVASVGLTSDGFVLGTATIVDTESAPSVSSKFNFSMSGTGKSNLNSFAPNVAANDFLTKCALAFDCSLVAGGSTN